MPAPRPLPSRRAAVGIAPFTLLAAALLAPAALFGCRSEVTCTAEVIDGDAIYKGSAAGKVADQALRNQAVKEACLGRCVKTKASHLDTCASRCAVDVASGKLGGRTACAGDKK